MGLTDVLNADCALVYKYLFGVMCGTSAFYFESSFFALGCGAVFFHVPDFDKVVGRVHFGDEDNVSSLCGPFAHNFPKLVIVEFVVVFHIAPVFDWIFMVCIGRVTINKFFARFP